MLSEKVQILLAILWLVPLSSAACEPPPVADSESLVQLALDCNPAQRSLDARVRAQASRAAATGHLDDPGLMLGIAPETFGNEQLPDGTVVELSQSLPWPGVLALRRAIEDSGTDILAFEYDRGAVTLAHSLRLAYADWRYREQLLAINRRHRDLWQSFIAANRTRYAVGSGRKSALLQAQHEAHQLQIEEIALSRAVERDKSRLARLLNLQPADLPASAPLPRREPPPDALALALDSLGNQPQLQRLAAEETRKSRQLALAEKDRYPQFNLLARHNNIWMDPDQRLFVGVGINLPLDIGGKRSARERSLAAEKLAVEWQRQDAALALQDTLRRADSRLREARETLQLYRDELLPLAEESLATARDDFAAGSGDFLDLLVAERNLLKVRRDIEAARRDRFVATAQLTAAAGLVLLDDWNSLGARSSSSASGPKATHTKVSARIFGK
ncbi:TolC family protein [Microbulbifer litoralis]|uniref:TolC family protein n=1 Tax=Microbulbifer litoralis TaxID=2933965 RepID=UPI0020282960|nr:TolC family protein [Microbulbifer sp. GX H0434]